MKRTTLLTHGLIYVLLHIVLFLVGLVIVIEAKDNNTLTSFGTSVMATGAAGWAIVVYVYFTVRETQWVKQFAEFGFLNAFTGRSAANRDEYRSRFDKVTANIDILGYGLRSLREDFSGDFARWKSKARVRILLLDPEIPPQCRATYASQRDMEEGNSEGTIDDDVRQFIRRASPLIDSRFQVRLYTCLPSMNYLRIDNDAFWGPYVVKHPSRNAPTFIVRNPGHMFTVLQEHFDNIWNDPLLSRDVPREWYGKSDKPSDPSTGTK